MEIQHATEKKQRTANSTYPKGGVYFRAASRSCSKDSFVVEVPPERQAQNR